MKKIKKTISPIFFWSSMLGFVMVSIFSIFVICNSMVVNAENPVISYDEYKSVIKKQQNDLKEHNLIDCDCEKRFKKEYPVIWEGKIISTFVNGKDFGVENFDKDSEYKQFYVLGTNNYIAENSENIEVVGRLVGVTCAYVNTVFGECVGEVVADQISLLND